MIPLQLLNTDRCPIVEAFDKVWISLSLKVAVFSRVDFGTCISFFW